MTQNLGAPNKKNAVEMLLARLEKAEQVLSTKKATAGFDGFIDTIARIIKNKEEGKPPKFFRRKKQFGKYIIEKEGTSFSLELEEKSARIGGNMPILSHALGSLGIQVNCIGALGHPKTSPIFRKLSPHCHVYSFADPGTSTAIEFEDGKIMLAQMGELNSLGWKDVKDKIGLDTIISLFKESHLVCMVNWSEIAMSTDIWKGVLSEVLTQYTGTQTAFFDLSDCSKKSDESILEVLSLLRDFSKYFRVTVGLNRNEAHRLYEVFYGKKPKKDLMRLGEKLFAKLNVSILLVHSSTEAITFGEDKIFTFDSFFIENPSILTGAGDNFNAGFCTGELLELDPGLSLVLAHAVAGSFVQNGVSPRLFEVNKFLQERLNK